MTERTTTERTRIQYFRRSDEPTLPFFFWGFLPLLLLAGLFWFGVTHFANEWIEEEVRENTQALLASEGLDWVNVEVDGQEVHLTGQGSASEGERAIGLAEGALGGTWAGNLVSPTVVTGDFSAPAPEPEPVPEEPAVWLDMSAHREGEVLVLEGEVASEDEKAALVAAAEAYVTASQEGELPEGDVPLVRIDDRLTISSERAMEGSHMLALRAVNTIGRCQRGTASVQTGVYSIRCAAHEDVAGEIRDAASAAADPGELGSINVLALEAIASCEAAMHDLLAGRTIEFAVGSAELRASSNGLLDEVAEAAQNCPGTLRVEGHTDDTGQLDANMQLSRDRAASVREALISRGVSADSLVPAGYGPTRPREEGTSAQARARNRRIEFHVVVDDE